MDNGWANPSGWPNDRSGNVPKTERDPLHSNTAANFRSRLEAVKSLERELARLRGWLSERNGAFRACLHT
jgi:hypothetical protein